MIGSSNNDPYYGVANIDNVRMFFFFVQLINLYAASTDVGTSYPHRFIKCKIISVAGPGKSIPANILTKTVIFHQHFPLMKEFLVKSISELRGV